MRVPLIDIPAQNRSIENELREAVDEVVREGRFILGPAVERFEAEFARYIGTAHCVGVNNGTSALHMALLACGVGPGDEVITTPHTWISTAWAISYTGARPVFADIDSRSYTLDPAAVEHAITPRTKAILPVHLYGQGADMVALQRLASAHGLALVEDAAQAHGATVGGRRVGSFGAAGCFSFYPAKNLGAFGEAGAVVTNDAAIAARIRRLRDHAQAQRHEHVELGYNTRMEGLQGAVLAVKLRHLDRWNAMRSRHARRYAELLAGVESLILPDESHACSHAWHLYVVQVSKGDRDALQNALAEARIATAVHYPTPVPLQPAYAHLGHRAGDFPVAEAVMRRCLSLPMYPELTDEQLDYTARTIRRLLTSL